MSETWKKETHESDEPSAHGEGAAAEPESVESQDGAFQHDTPEHAQAAGPQPEQLRQGMGYNRPSEEKMHIERLEKELEKTRDQMLRAMADTENMRRRAVREREDAGKYAISGFARDLISVADNLRRALEAIPADLDMLDDRIKSLFNGIEATERELLSVFERNGIKKLEPMHQIFDPNLHEVMFEAPISGFPPGTICQLVQPGYTLHERLLRPARVGVVKDEGAESGGSKEPPPEPGHNIDTQV